MAETVIGILSFTAGILLVLLFKSFARFVVEHQNKFWGFHFGAREIKVTEFVSLMIGLGFIVIGFFFMFRLLRFH